MNEINLNKNKDRIVGAVRLSEDTYQKVYAAANKNGVTLQEIIRAVLDNCIDEVTFK